MDAFDADVLIYAAVSDHKLGKRVAALFPRKALKGADQLVGTGSLLLLPELLSKPLRERRDDEAAALAGLLGRLDLRPVDLPTAELAVSLAAKYKLRAAAATHLATAVFVGADRFITNNRKDFSGTISEIMITFPEDL